jgi:hypothetical protein
MADKSKIAVQRIIEAKQKAKEEAAKRNPLLNPPLRVQQPKEGK